MDFCSLSLKNNILVYLYKYSWSWSITFIFIRIVICIARREQATVRLMSYVQPYVIAEDMHTIHYNALVVKHISSSSLNGYPIPQKTGKRKATSERWGLPLQKKVAPEIGAVSNASLSNERLQDYLYSFKKLKCW